MKSELPYGMKGMKGPGANTNYQKSSEVEVPPAGECSWLGRFQDAGWSVRIHPRLNDSQWKVFGERAEETWDATRFAYDPVKSLELLGELFPRHTLALMWPKCGYRTAHGRVGQPPVYVVCNAQARHTETKVVDVTGARVGIARCDEHQGQL